MDQSRGGALDHLINETGSRMRASSGNEDKNDPFEFALCLSDDDGFAVYSLGTGWLLGCGCVCPSLPI